MNAAFTPGPWYATQADDRFPVRIREESTDAVLATGDDGGHPDPEFAIPDDVIMANAQLMASAPELYHALSDMCAWVKNAGTPTTAILQRANFALARARGEMVVA